MKIKVLALIAMLLMSVTAMAQPSQYLWYMGKTRPTETNFNTLAQVSDKPLEDIYVDVLLRSATGDSIFVIVPYSWTDNGQHMDIIDDEIGGAFMQDEVIYIYGVKYLLMKYGVKYWPDSSSEFPLEFHIYFDEGTTMNIYRIDDIDLNKAYLLKNKLDNGVFYPNGRYTEKYMVNGRNAYLCWRFIKDSEGRFYMTMAKFSEGSLVTAGVTNERPSLVCRFNYYSSDCYVPVKLKQCDGGIAISTSGLDEDYVCVMGGECVVSGMLGDSAIWYLSESPSVVVGKMPEVTPSYYATFFTGPDQIDASKNAYNTIISAKAYHVGENIEVPQAPVKEGYTFVGWSQEIPGTMPDHHVICHAIYAMPGDVNADGDVNIADVMAIYNVMAKKDTNPTADVNADGDVNIADVMAVYNIMAGKGAPSTTKYYYYAGWECPRNEAELASRGTLISNYSTLTSGRIIKDYISNPIENESFENWYIIVPSKIKVVDADGTEVAFQSNNKASWNNNYSIIKSDYPGFELGTVKLVVR